ncbi:Protein of unknown function, partial [Cotesia congregata]
KNIIVEIFNAHKSFCKKELYINGKEDVFANALTINYDKSPEVNSLEKYKEFISKIDEAKAKIFQETIQKLKEILSNSNVVLQYGFSVEST